MNHSFTLPVDCFITLTVDKEDKIVVAILTSANCKCNPDSSITNLCAVCWHQRQVY